MAPEHPGGSAAETRSGEKGKMEKLLVRMEKFIVRMEKFHVKIEKTLYAPGRIELLTRGSTYYPFVRTQGKCSSLLVLL